MQELIYYPAFEVRDLNWLKFALLYLDRLCPIVPESGDRHLTESFQRVRNDTDLIRSHRPGPREGNDATLDAMETIEKVLQNPERYQDAFQDVSFLERWRDPNSQRFILFREKYTYLWERFCTENRLARKTEDGIAMSRDLALVYMSILAHVISDSTGIPPITDYTDMDRIAVLTRQASPVELSRTHVAHGIVKLKLPRDISQISLARIIDIRNGKGFKDRLHAFHAELDEYISRVEDGTARGNFLSTRGNAFLEFTDEIARAGTQATVVGLSVWLVLSKVATVPQYLKELAAVTSLTVGSVIAIRNTWRNTETKRLTRKYLANLDAI